MVWSIYNIPFKTSDGLFLYNSYTNNLVELSPDVFDKIEAYKQGDFSSLSSEAIKYFEREQLIIEDDEDIYRRIKIERTLTRYDNNYLSLTIAPTTGCNFKCTYCYESGVKEKTITNSRVSIDNTINFVKSFKTAQYLRVTWYGGEPLLRFDYIEHLSKELMKVFKNYQAYIITNAYLLDKEKISKLKTLHIKGLQVTIDGLEDTHNKRRPHKLHNDSFQTIIKNLDDLFVDYPEVNVSLRVNTDKNNENEYHELYDFLKEKYGKYNINIHPGYVTDEFSKEPNRCCLLHDEINKFVTDQYDKYKIPISLYPKSSLGECCARHVTGFVIGPNGELYKCWNDIGNSEKEIGNINKFSVSNNLCLKYLLDNDPLEDKNCKDCFCFPVCDGGCPYRRIFHKEEQTKYCNAKRQGLKAFLLRYLDSKLEK